VLDEVNRLKRERQADQEELEELKQTRARLSYLDDTETKLNRFCQRARKKLDNATIQDKRLALDAMDIRIIASTERIDIKGSIPLEITSVPRSTDLTTLLQTKGMLCQTHLIFRRRALIATITVLTAISAAPTAGLSRMPKL
jgi:hypothetical protein